MRCPKCGSENVAGAWVCSRCDFVLDSSFLGEDILNDPGASAAPASVQTKPVKMDGPSRDELGGDALILGQLGEGEIQSFVSDQTGGFLKVNSDDVEEVAPAAVYLGGDVAALLTPTAVLRHTSDAGSRRSALSKFELFVFDLIDGRKNLGEVRGRTGLSQGDVRIAAAMLIDKRMVESAAARAPVDVPRSPGTATIGRRGLGSAETSELPPLEDQTRELANLPPLDESYEVVSAKLPLADEPEREEAVVVPVAPRAAPPPPPAAAAPAPPKPPPPKATVAAPPPHAAPPHQAAPPAAAAPGAGFRPALRAAPLRPMRHTPPPPPKRAAGAAPLPSPPGSQAVLPAPTSAAVREPKARAAEYYELALKDLREGRPARGFSYARMAADADPGEEKYQQLLRDWDKRAAGRGADDDPVGAAQQAEASGDFERAIELLRKACELFPKSAPVHNRLGVLLATRAKDFKAAYNASMRAVELEPENATYKSNMMKILARVESDDMPVKDKPRGGLLGGLLKRS
ncbi:MAG: tetratricopeptide repeat protein [Deltaproteobacteria bacterium]|nr:tetratricopeptide repeat protein [Deltaproteobacteria bacterium]